MSTTETRRDADEQARAQLASIREMVAALRKAREDAGDDVGTAYVAVEQAEQAIHEDALSVEVRTGWYQPGGEKAEPEEFKILLCTGGPAVQLRGTLDRWCQPETVELESQGWFIPWQALSLTSEERDDLLEYARCFYFGDN